MTSEQQSQDTSYESKSVMIKAQRGDTVAVNGFGEFKVVRRADTYCGPCLTLSPSESNSEFNLQLTAPGPQSELQLWFPDRDKPGWRSGWNCGPEVSAELVDSDQYDICTDCGEPIADVEHERAAAFGVCPGGHSD